jgi:DNA-binding NtrC family response regulator
MLQAPTALLLTSDPGNRKHLNELLNNHAVLIHTGNLRDMRSRMHDSRADLLLCDWSFYAGCWREIQDSVQQYAPELPVIVLSRNGGEREWISALESGAFDLLAWPSSQTTLLAAVEQARASYQARILFEEFPDAVDDIPKAG